MNMLKFTSYQILPLADIVLAFSGGKSTYGSERAPMDEFAQVYKLHIVFGFFLRESDWLKFTSYQILS